MKIKPSEAVCRICRIVVTSEGSAGIYTFLLHVSQSIVFWLQELAYSKRSQLQSRREQFMQLLLFLFMFNSFFILAADHNETVGDLKDLKSRLYQSLENTESHDETMDVLSLLLKHPKLSAQDSASFQRELQLRRKAEAEEEAEFREREMHKFFATLADDTHVSIVKKYGEKSKDYSKAMSGDYNRIDEMIDYSGKDGVPHIVSMYWLYKIRIHPDVTDDYRDAAMSALKTCYESVYTWAKSRLEDPERRKKYALFFRQWQNARLGREVMPPHEFIQLYADDQWMEVMQKHAKELAPEVFQKAQESGFFDMLEMARTFEEKCMPCRAMYWLHEILCIENLDKGIKSAAKDELQTIYKKLWTSE